MGVLCVHTRVRASLARHLCSPVTHLSRGLAHRRAQYRRSISRDTVHFNRAQLARTRQATGKPVFVKSGGVSRSPWGTQKLSKHRRTVRFSRKFPPRRPRERRRGRRDGRNSRICVACGCRQFNLDTHVTRQEHRSAAMYYVSAAISSVANVRHAHCHVVNILSFDSRIEDTRVIGSALDVTFGSRSHP